LSDSANLSVTVLIKNNYDQLVFSYDMGQYHADFNSDFSFQLADDPSYVIKSSVDKDIVLDNFEETNSKNRYAVLRDTVTMKPGKYIFQIKAYTQMGRRNLFRQIDTLNWQMRNGFWFSEFYLVDDSGVPYIGKSRYPFGAKGKFLLPIYWEPDKKPDSLVFYLYRRSPKKFVAGRTEKEISNSNLFVMPGKFEKLPEGLYDIIVMAYKGKRIMARYSKDLEVKWFGKPWSLRKFGLSVKPLKAALGNEEYEKIIGSKDEREGIHNYWKSLDPTPETEFNEIEDEFYRRADYVQKKYGGERYYGWERDLGKVYLKYGKPEKVIDNRLNPGGRGFITWIYLKIGKQFIFVWDGEDFKLSNIQDIIK
jgi:GWxTD domain-containing protein